MFLPIDPRGDWNGAIMQHATDARVIANRAGAGVAVAGGLVAEVTSGAVQNAGFLVAICGVATAIIPLVFKDRSEKRQLASDAEKAKMRARIEEQERKIAELQGRAAQDAERLGMLEQIKPQVEANVAGLAVTALKADKAYQFLVDQQWIDGRDMPVPVVPIRVLVVEDNVETGRAMVALLGRAGFTTAYAFSVADAIDRLQSPIPYDWMTLDLKISGGDGEDVLKAVRRMRLSTRVAITTGSTDHDRIERLRVYRPEKVFMKPINYHELIRTLLSDPEDDDDRNYTSGQKAGLPPSPPADQLGGDL